MSSLKPSKYIDLQPFQAWVQQSLPAVYDDSLSYTDLLAKMLAYLNNLVANNNTLSTDVTNAINYINTFFESTDFQDKVDDKLNRMAEDGSLSRLIQPLFDAYKVQIDSTVATQNTSISNIQSQQTILKERMDTFTKLPSGSTSGDAELQDIRVGANGVTYSTAGNAVRGQYSQLKEDIVKIFDKTVEKIPTTNLIPLNIHNKNGEFIHGCYVNQDGSFVENASYLNSYLVNIKKNTLYYKNTNSPCVIYNKNLEIILAVDYDTTSFTTPSDAEYISYGFHKTTLNSTYICEFNKNLVYTPYSVFNDAGKCAINRFLTDDTKYNTYEINGYLRTDNTIIIDSSLYGKYTEPIPCNPYDKFNYRGIGEYSVASCIYFDKELNILSTYQVNAKDKSVVIEVPDECCYVVFSSYSTTPQVILEFSAIRKNSENILSGKKYVSCGDSFTEGDFTSLSSAEIKQCKDEVRGIYKTYPCLIANRNKMEYVQKAICGGTIKTFYESILTTIPTDADYITIAYGLNDFSYNMTIGSIDDDASADTFYGYWNACINWLITNCQKA